MLSVSPASAKAKPSRFGSSCQAATLPKKRGLTRQGLPFSGQTTSQLPHSLHASTKLPICHGFLKSRGVDSSLVPPSAVGTRRSVGYVPGSMTSTRLALFGQTEMHLLQFTQSKNASFLLSFKGDGSCLGRLYR